MSSIRLRLLACGLLALVSMTLSADTVHLTNGGTLEGRVRYENGKIILEQPNGMVILDPSRVEFVEKSKTVLDEYDERAAALKAAAQPSADDYVALARFAADRNLKLQAEASYKKALALDAGHAGARIALGFLG